MRRGILIVVVCILAACGEAWSVDLSGGNTYNNAGNLQGASLNTTQTVRVLVKNESSSSWTNYHIRTNRNGAGWVQSGNLGTLAPGQTHTVSVLLEVTIAAGGAVHSTSGPIPRTFAGTYVTDLQIWGGGVERGSVSFSVSGDVTVNYGGSRSDESGPWAQYNEASEFYALNLGGAPTPTPTPTPTPEPVGDVSLGLEGSDGGTAGIYIDLDGDGVKEKVAEFAIDSEGNGTFDIPPEWEGKDYEIVIEKLWRDGLEVPTYIEFAKGTFGGTGDVEIENDVVIGGGGHTGGTTIDSNGNKIGGGIDVIDSTVGGDGRTIYTWTNPGGGTSSVVYNDTDVSALAKTGDVQMASAQNSKENEQIVGELDGIGQGIGALEGALEGIGDKLDGIGEAIEEGNEEPPAPSPEEVVGDLYGGLDHDPEVEAPTRPSISVGSGGGGDFWSLEVAGHTMNFNPAANAMVATLKNWAYALMTWAATLYLVMALGNMTWAFQVAISQAPQTLTPKVDVAGTSVGILTGPVISGLVVASIIAGSLIWSTYVNGIAPLGGSAGASGQSLFSSGGGGGGNPFFAAMDFLLYWFPIQHALTCLTDYLLAVVFRSSIYMTYQAIRKFFFA